MVIVAIIAVIVVIVVIVSVSKSQSKKALREKYLNLPLTKELAVEAGENVLKNINSANRSIYQSDISVHMSISSYVEESGEDKGKFGGITGDAYYNFKTHNLRFLSSGEITAFLWAIATLAHQYVLDNLDKDPSGTRYTLSNVKENWSYGLHYSFTYTAPNGNYVAPKDW